MNKMLYIIASVAALAVFATSAFAGSLVNVSGASGIALNGYDPVAFFIEKKPMYGDPANSATYERATYLFASKAHKLEFGTNPQKYVPQYGGYCAFGVAKGALFPVEISTWQIRDGKLYLNFNQAVVEMFNKDFPGHVAKAEKNWPDLMKKHSK